MVLRECTPEIWRVISIIRIFKNIRFLIWNDVMLTSVSRKVNISLSSGQIILTNLIQFSRWVHFARAPILYQSSIILFCWTYRFDLIYSLVAVTGQRYVIHGQLWNSSDTGLNPSSFRPRLADPDSYLLPWMVSVVVQYA